MEVVNFKLAFAGFIPIDYFLLDEDCPSASRRVFKSSCHSWITCCNSTANTEQLIVLKLSNNNDHVESLFKIDHENHAISLLHYAFE